MWGDAVDVCHGRTAKEKSNMGDFQKSATGEGCEVAKPYPLSTGHNPHP
jgi:hypothetical protein